MPRHHRHPPSRSRLSPEERRDQLLDLGVHLFATTALEKLSVDRLATSAGVSRGLLYHYFGDKTGFREAVVRRAAADFVARTEPPADGDPITRLVASLEAYVDYIDTSYEGYLSLVRGAATDPTLRAVYDEARNAVTDRFFVEAPDFFPETPAERLLIRGWQKLAEELVLTWKAGETPVSRSELVHLLVTSLPALNLTTG